MTARPAAFIDRDGVLNHRIPGDTYVTSPEELTILPHAVEALREIHERGYPLVVITNQRGVARGFMSEDDVAAIHQKLRAAFEDGGAPLLAIYHCPHDNHHACECRKPAPGMLLQAARDHDLDLTRSVLVGDSESDLEAGRRAGVPALLKIESDADLRQVLPKVPSL